MTATTGLRPLSELRTHATVLAVVICAFWVLVPFLQHGSEAADGQAFLAAGRLAATQPEDAYPTKPPDRDGLVKSDEFVRASCAVHPSDDCAAVAVPFVSPPIVFPLVEAMRDVDGDAGLLAFRLVGGALFAAGMALQWRRFAALGDAWPVALALAAAALTPLVVHTLAAAQVTPLVFFVACVAVTGLGGAAAVFVGFALAVAVAFKAYPVVALGVLARHRRWLAVAVTSVVLVVLLGTTLVRYGTGVFSAFVDGVRAMDENELRSHFSTSLDAFAHLVHSSWSATGVTSIAFLAARVVLVGVVVIRAARRAGPEVEWALVWVGLLLVLPLTHDHYFVVLLPAAATVVARSARAAGWVVAAAAATMPFPFAQSSNVVLGPVIAVVAFTALAVAALGVRSAGEAELVPASADG
jgi:hypothetical protein